MVQSRESGILCFKFASLGTLFAKEALALYLKPILGLMSVFYSESNIVSPRAAQGVSPLTSACLFWGSMGPHYCSFNFCLAVVMGEGQMWEVNPGGGVSQLKPELPSSTVHSGS